MVPTNPPPTWNVGYTLLMAVPFIALAIVFLDLPVWVEVIVLIVILGMVGAGSALLRSRGGGWRPSETLPTPTDDER